jgi:Histone deacetylase domain
MKLGLPIVWSDRHRLHEPGEEVWIGVRKPGTEVPRRAEAIRDALRACDAQFVAAEPQADDDLFAVHDGAQSIFRERADVLTGSVHVDPGAGWFPHFLGFAHETGAEQGTGANRDVPPSPGTGDDGWLQAIDDLAAWATDGGAQALVVALGVDAAAGDRENPLNVTEAGYREPAASSEPLGLPTVLVQEGGYDLTTIGALVAETLAGVREGATRA